MPERINAGHALVIVGAIVLLVSLFLDWYEVGGFEGEAVSAWAVFEIADLLLAGLALVALATALPIRLGGPSELGGLLAARWLPWFGLAALAFVAVTLINDPPAVRDRPLELGAWLGLVGAVLMAAGGVLSTARVSLVISPRSGERPTTAGTPPPPPPAAPPPTDAETERLR